MSVIEIRQLTSIDELNEMVNVEKAVWKMHTVPVHQTFTAMNNGGIILGAFDRNKMVGFLYSFAGFTGKRPYLCSHMLGILPEYRTSGLGVKMKLTQKKLAKQLGYSMITWTFDPLESKNAYINLHKLGASGVAYYENHYGNLNDQLNQGLPTDRIVIEWSLEKDRPFKQVQFDIRKLLLEIGDDHSPVIVKSIPSVAAKNDYWFVAIPNDFQVMKQQNIQLAKRWRAETRAVFQALFQEGYYMTDIFSHQTNKQSYYLFSRGEYKL